MVNQPEFREGLLVWGRAPSRACPERSRRVQAERSSAVLAGEQQLSDSLMQWCCSGCAGTLWSWCCAQRSKLGAVHPTWRKPPGCRLAVQRPSSTDPTPQFGTIHPYLGLAIDQIELPGVPPEDAASLLAATPLKIGEPLTREALHDAMQALFATGRFADIQAEADRTDTAGVRLRFLTTANFFVGMLTIEGVTTNPSPNQLASATRLQLGELYAREKIDRALAGIQRVLEENGFHQSRVTISEERDQQQHQVNMTFHVVPGPRAVVGEIKLWKATPAIPLKRSGRSPSCIPAIRSSRAALRALCNEFAAAIRSRIVCSPRSQWPTAPTIPSSTRWTTSSKWTAVRWCRLRPRVLNSASAC